MSQPHPITTSITGCARCRGAGHEDLTFAPLTHPIELEDELGDPYTHWAPCPANGEPILMRWKRDSDARG